VKKYDLIRTLRDGDVERLSDVIDTSRDNVEDIKKKLEEESYEVVAKTGVNEFDKNYPLSKGEILVIQGGSGVGKSRSGINVCNSSIFEFKKNVLVLSLEQKANRILPMFMARHSTVIGESQGEWINDKDIIHGTLDENGKMISNIVLDDLTNNNDY